MLIPIRKTAAGTEYWDTEKKLVVTGGVDLANEPEHEEEPVNIDGENLEDMTVKQLRDFSKQMEIEIPSDIKKKEDIISFLIESKK